VEGYGSVYDASGLSRIRKLVSPLRVPLLECPLGSYFVLLVISSASLSSTSRWDRVTRNRLHM